MNNIFKFNKKLYTIDKKVCSNNFILIHGLIFSGTIGISSIGMYNYLEYKQKIEYLKILNYKQKLNYEHELQSYNIRD